MTVPIWVWIALIPSCVVITYVDYIVFGRWTKCECGRSDKQAFLLASFLEITLFLAGIALGGIILK